MSLFNRLFAASTQGTDGGSQPDYMIWVMVGLIVLVVVMMIPSFFSGRKKRKAAAERMSRLMPGDKVMLTNGMIGMVTAVDQMNRTVTVNIGANGADVPVMLDLGGIYRIIEPEEEKAREEKVRLAEKEAEVKKDEKVVMSKDDIEADEKRKARLKEKELRADEKRKAKLAGVNPIAADSQNSVETAENDADGTSEPFVAADDETQE